MSLLDGFLGQGWDDPKSQAMMALAGGLLSGDFGRGAKDYGSVMAGAKDAEMKRQLLKSQVDENISQAAYRAQQAKQAEAAQGLAAQKQDMLSKLFGGGTSPGAFVPSAGMGPTMPPSMQSQSGIGGLDINKVAQLKAMHGIDLMDAFKWANDPLKMEQGSTYKDRINGTERYMPKVGDGVAPNAGGFYGELPGYGAAQASIEGAKAGAIEKAKAGFDPLTYTPKGSGNPIMSNRAAVMAPQQPGVMSSGYAGGSRDGANAESIKMMMAELANPKYDAPTKAGIVREIQRMQQQSGITGGIELQSEAEKATSVDQAKANIKPIEQRQSAISSNKYMSDVVSQTLNHPGLSTGTGLSSLLHPANYVRGTDAKDFSVMLDQIKGGAFLQAFENLKGGGQITEVEGKKATDAIARLNVAQSTPEFKKSLTDLKLVLDGSQQRMNAAMPGGTTPQPDAPKQAAKVPMKGMVQGGYKFKGGNPADQANWEKQ